MVYGGDRVFDCGDTSILIGGSRHTQSRLDDSTKFASDSMQNVSFVPLGGNSRYLERGSG